MISISPIPKERAHPMSRAVDKQTVVTPESAGAVQAVVRALTGLPNATVRGMFGHECVQVDGALCTELATLVAPGVRVRVCYDPERKYREAPKPKRNRAFRLVFEDAHLVVVDKFAGVLTEPNKGERDTLVDYLGSYLQRGTGERGARQKSRGRFRPWVVHRLDRETSGLLVLCKRREAAEGIRAQFRERKPERVYIAVAAGDLPKAKGTVRSHLTTDPASLDQFSTEMEHLGKLAVTHYEALNRVPGATTVRVRLETGRRNQIRVHFAEMGHPLLGDPRYRPEAARHPLWKVQRVALHAAVLGFEHPVTGERLRFESPPPPEFAPFLPE